MAGLGGGTLYPGTAPGVGVKVPGVAPGVRGQRPQAPSRGPRPQIQPRSPVNRRVAAAGKAMGAHGTKPAPAKAAAPAKAKSPYIGGQLINPGGVFSRAEQQKNAGAINEAEAARNKNIMETFGAKNRENLNAEGTTANRLTGINQGAQGALGGLLQGAEGSAKTADNATAERALSAEKAIETTGQNMATSSGGYLDPQIRAQIEAGGQNFANILAGNAAGTQARGELGVNDIRTLAASNVARGQENQTELRNRFFGERQKNTAAQNAELGRSAGKAREERIELPLKLYPDILAKNRLEQQGAIAKTKNELTAQGLNIKGRAVTNQERTGRARREGELERNATGRRNAATGEARVGAQREATSQRESASIRSNELGKERNQISKLSAEDRAAYDKARIKIDQEKASGKGQSPAAGRKYMQAINNWYPTVNQEWNNALAKNKGANRQALYNAVVKSLEEGKKTGKGGKEPGKAVPANYLHAAMSLIFNGGKLVGRPKYEALEAGMTPEMNRHWFS